MMRWLAVAVALGMVPLAHADTHALLKRAAKTPGYEAARTLQARLFPTTDGQSFYLVWKPPGEVTDWIVTLHGAERFATDDLAAWQPQLEGRGVGVVALQWWVGEGDKPGDYYTPEQVQTEIDALMAKLEIKPGQAMLYGFSKASTMLYGLAARSVAGNGWFRLYVANAGGVVADYAPNKSIESGIFGEEPLDGSQWVMVCGRQDPDPKQAGCPAMNEAAQWVDKYGGVVLDVIEDPKAGHEPLVGNGGIVEAILGKFIK